MNAIIPSNLPSDTQKLEALFQAFADIMFILDQENNLLDFQVNKNSQLYDSPLKYIHRNIRDVFPAEIQRRITVAAREAHRTRQPVSETLQLTLPTGERSIEVCFTAFESNQCLVLGRDVTLLHLAQSESQLQVDRLAALRAIDLAISSGLDLNLTLSMILSHVTAQLNMDAATILMLDPHSQLLEFAAGLGLHTSSLQSTRLRVGEGYAGRAALDRRTLSVTNLKSRKTDFLRSPAFQKEGFVSYYAVPLLAKGQVLGVLEIFKRSNNEAPPDWVDFLNSLAGQAALAIDNAIMFKTLQRSNVDLTLAYDKTIEGWSNALDLRDKETEGHTKRVVELTLRLARHMQLPEPDLVNLRRGAVLHDIGKVAIPDSILLKPGPLTDQEWEIMRQHPLIAVDLLTPISYLVPALDIPRAHHEKWDGSGYPNQLAGTAIPLPARLFAVVDVYDALISKRPYRPAWSETEALDYIRTNTGTHFDPSIVPVFMNMLAQPRPMGVDEKVEVRLRREGKYG